MQLDKLIGFTPGPLSAYDTSTGWTIRGGPQNQRTADGLRKGDAHLYAAAPDLLELAKLGLELADMVVEVYPRNRTGGDPEILVKARALREKARS